MNTEERKRIKAMQRSEVAKLRRSAKGAQWVWMSEYPELTASYMPVVRMIKVVPRYMVKAVPDGLRAKWVYKKKYEHLS